MDTLQLSCSPWSPRAQQCLDQSWCPEHLVKLLTANTGWEDAGRGCGDQAGPRGGTAHDRGAGPTYAWTNRAALSLHRDVPEQV